MFNRSDLPCVSRRPAGYKSHKVVDDMNMDAGFSRFVSKARGNLAMTSSYNSVEDCNMGKNCNLSNLII